MSQRTAGSCNITYGKGNFVEICNSYKMTCGLSRVTPVCSSDQKNEQTMDEWSDPSLH